MNVNNNEGKKLAFKRVASWNPAASTGVDPLFTGRNSLSKSSTNKVSNVDRSSNTTVGSKPATDPQHSDNEKLGRRSSWTNGVFSDSNETNNDVSRASFSSSIASMIPNITTTKSVWKQPVHHAISRSDSTSGIPINELLQDVDNNNHPSSHSSHRTENWHELFYDLIFVAASLQIGNILKQDISVENILQTAVLFLILRNTWDNLMMYQNRFDTVDLLHYFFYLLQAIAAFVMTIHLEVSSNETRWNSELHVSPFSTAAAISRFTLVIMYLHVFYYTDKFRVGFRNYLLLLTLSQFISGCLFTAVAIIHAVSKQSGGFNIIWLISFFIERTFVSVTVTIMQRRKNKRGRIPQHFEHMVHRQGVFILLISGEAIIQLVQASTAFNTTGYLRGCLGFGIVYGVGICYYEQQQICLANPTNVKNTAIGYLWELLHICLSLSILFFAVGVKEVYLNTSGLEDDDTDIHNPDGGIGYNRDHTPELLMTISASISLITIFILRLVHKGFKFNGKFNARFPTLGVKTRAAAYGSRFILVIFMAFVPLFTYTSTATITTLAILVTALVILDTFALSNKVEATRAEELGLVVSRRASRADDHGSSENRLYREVNKTEKLDDDDSDDSFGGGSFFFDPSNIVTPKRFNIDNTTNDITESLSQNNETQSNDQPLYEPLIHSDKH